MWRKSMIAFATTMILVTAAACDSVVAPEANLTSQIPGATLFSAPHYPAATDESLPRIYIEGEMFDPFCESAPRFVAQKIGDGFVLSPISPGTPLLYTRADCDRWYDRCAERCRRTRGLRAKAVCWGACMTGYAACIAGDPFFSTAAAPSEIPL